MTRLTVDPIPKYLLTADAAPYKRETPVNALKDPEYLVPLNTGYGTEP